MKQLAKKGLPPIELQTVKPGLNVVKYVALVEAVSEYVVAV